MDKLKNYAVSYLATIEIDGKVDIGHQAGVVNAESYDEASSIALERCKIRFPKSKGWQHWSVSCEDFYVRQLSIACSHVDEQRDANKVIPV